MKKLKNIFFNNSNTAALMSTVLLLSFPIMAKEKEDVLQNLKYSNDEQANQQKAIQTELLVNKAEQQAVQQIQKLLRKYKGTPLEVDMMFRLAELYMRRAKSALFFEVNKQDGVAASFIPKKLKSKSSKGYVSKAIGIYDSIERRFKNYGDMDLVLFNNALASQQISNEKKAEDLYWKIIKRYPQSPLVPDAHLAIGELAFKQKRFQHALNHFNAVKKYPDSRVYPYGLYKAAWTYYNLHDAQAGMKELEAVVAYGVYVEKEKIDARLDLRKEALADMTIFFEDVYTPDKAYDYFKSQAGNLPYSEYILKLGHIYDRHSAYKNLEIVYLEFTSRDPYNANIPQVRDELVWNYENMKKREFAVKQLKSLHDVCQSDSKWLSKNTADLQTDIEKQAVLSECLSKLDHTSIRLAQKWLRLWDKNPTYPVFADSSEEAFRIYLDHRQVTDEYRKARYVYAELLFKRNKFRLASENYYQAAQDFIEDKANKTLLHDSSYAAILSLEKAVEVEKSKWKEQDEKQFKLLVGFYVKHQPKGQYRLDVEFKLALIAYEKGRYLEAGQTFQRLGKQFAGTSKGLKAQDLYLDILNIKKDYALLKDYAKELLGNKKGLSETRGLKLKQVYEESYFLLVQSFDEKEEFTKAVDGYKAFAKENSSSKLAPKAWLNAINLYYKMGALNQGAEAAESYYRMFPQTPETKSTLIKAASVYEQIGQLKKAIRVLNQLASIDKEKTDYWTNLAADYLVLSEQPQTATQFYEKVVSSQGSSKKERVHALTQLVDLYSKDKAKVYNKKLHFKYLDLLYRSNEQPFSGEAYLEIVNDIYESKDFPNAFSAAKQLLSLKGNSNKVNARARYIQAEILRHEFESQSLKSNVERVALVIQLKTQRLDKAQQAYQSAIRYSDPSTTIDALEELAALYRSYVVSLREMPVPKDLPEDAVAAFRSEIENLAMPMEERSIETLNQAYENAKKFAFYDGRVDKLKKQLDRYNLKPNFLSEYEVELPSYELPTYFVGVPK
ncbi:MAG: tetratricopeptide repeat protein [Bdellovibrionales bacterium]|nr:tetratricopeptide repeat protein [Bdellovibrionales bacterium]